ncbi:MAG TPA: hypothetical protein VD735_06620 [Candidatus Saccharimonadales bacterium]|nr:hypothetical protein [Candidatus Saccharimonadales bacterium]
MARLPQPGSDEGDWGDILNEYLTVSHNSDGTLKGASIPADASTQRVIVSKDGTTVATRRQINFVSGANTTLSVADNPGSNRVDVTVAAAIPAPVDHGAAMLGLAAQTMQYSQATTKYTINSGVCVFMLVRLPSTTITMLGAWKSIEGIGATGTCGLALYTEAGVLIDQTTSMAAAFAAPGVAWISAPLSGGALTVTAGNYYIALLSNMTSGPQFAATSIINDAPPINGHYPAIYLTGRNTFPTSFTPSAAIKNNGAFYLTAH